MNSLRELIQRGDYELAAYRLIYGVVHACVEQAQRDDATDAGCPAGCVRGDESVAQRGVESDG